MAESKRVSVPAAQLALYQRLISRLDEAEAKSNFGSAYTAVNGNMSSMISKHGVVGIRLPSAERETFIAKFGTELFRGDPAWPPAKEFVAVPQPLLEDTDALLPYFKRSLEFTRSLKPKTKKGSPESGS